MYFSKYITEIFDQGIGSKHVFKEVMKFPNLVKLGLTQYDVVGYYERKLNYLSDLKTLHTVP